MSLDWNKYKSRLEQELCPPGNGVFTIHTAQEKRQGLHKKIYGTKDNVEDLWSKTFGQSLFPISQIQIKQLFWEYAQILVEAF